jgi:Amt family ammonium transporter
MCGIFVSESLGGQGLAEGMTIGSQFIVQLKAVIITILFSGVGTFILLKIVDATLGLRVSQEDEVSGLDIALHDERGYNY